MLTFSTEPDGRVAIYLDGTLLGRARNQAHADDWARRYHDAVDRLAPRVWRVERAWWERATSEQRRRYRQSGTEQHAA